MKIKIESDLHLGILDYFEHDEYIPDLKDIDVYLVSEICEEKFSRNWLINLCKNNPQTIIIECPSNHLPYRDNIEKCHNRRLELMESLPNYRFLENDSCVINGIRFIGACLWTDMNNRDERVIHHAWSRMNDYHKIRYTKNYLKLSPYRTIKLFEDSRDYIFKTLNSSKESCVVLTHHQPFITEIRDNLSYAYMSDMEKEFNNCTNLPIIWASGHTHISCDIIKEYNHGSVRFISNQRGYPSECNEDRNFNNSGFNKDLVIEI